MSLIDSTKISVCHNRRTWSHKVMAAFAARGKTRVDWFYGFKLHLVINDQGELMSVKITAGNADDRNPVPELARSLFGRLFGDRGYIPQPLFEQLWEEKNLAICFSHSQKLWSVLWSVARYPTTIKPCLYILLGQQHYYVAALLPNIGM
jgi:hypothetical protein